MDHPELDLDPFASVTLRGGFVLQSAWNKPVVELVSQ